jgi:hypothetical protein
MQSQVLFPLPSPRGLSLAIRKSKKPRSSSELVCQPDTASPTRSTISQSALKVNQDPAATQKKQFLCMACSAVRPRNSTKIPGRKQVMRSRVSFPFPKIARRSVQN